MIPLTLLMAGWGTALGASGAAPASRPPDTLLLSTCSATGVDFVDVDGDGQEDLLFAVGRSVYVWGTAVPNEVPTRWTFDEGAAGLEEMWHIFTLQPASDGHQATLLHSNRGVGKVTAYWVAAGLELVLAWDDMVDSGSESFGDLDGDGLPEASGSDGIRLSSLGDGGWVPWPGIEGFSPESAAAVGDVNHDGFDDLFVHHSQGVDLTYTPYVYDKVNCTWGPAALFLGSPTGLLPEPLWTLYGEAPFTAVGRRVVAVPEADALVVDLVEGGLWAFNPDCGPQEIGIIREAGSASAWLDYSSPVPVPGVDPDGYYMLLEGLQADDGAGSAGIYLVESSGAPDGVQWFQLDDQAQALGSIPSTEWTEDWVDIDRYAWYLRGPRVGARQAMAVAVNVPYSPDAILIWGRDAEGLGPSAEGSGDADCLFAAVPYSDPEFWVPPTEPTETTGPDDPPATESDDSATTERVDPPPKGCGCRDGSPTLGVVPLLLLLLLGARRRTARRTP
jgi:hypothetical protein